MSDEGTVIQLGDVAEGAAEETADAAAEATEEGTSMGDVLLDAIDRLDEKGLLAPALFGPENIDSGLSKSGGGGDGGGLELDADAIADVGKTVIDSMGDVRISEVVKYAENNPEQVNQLIEQKMGE